MSVFSVEAVREYPSWKIVCLGKELEVGDQTIIAREFDPSCQEVVTVAKLIRPDQIKLSQAVEGILTISMVFDENAVNNCLPLRNRLCYI